MKIECNYKIIGEYIDIKKISQASFEAYRNKLRQAIIEIFEEGKPEKIWSASVIVGQIDNLGFSIQEYEKMNLIASNLPQLELSKTYDYREVVILALEVVLHFVNEGKCKCIFYPKRTRFFSENYEVEYGFIRHSKETVVNCELFYTDQFFTCNYCGAELTLRTQDGGHSPHSSWSMKEK